MDTGIAGVQDSRGRAARPTCRATSMSGRSIRRRSTPSGWPTVQHDMTQGFVLTQYFYEQLIQFEKDPASLRDTIGEMVYSMDVDQQVHRARKSNSTSKRRWRCAAAQQAAQALTGFDLAEARLAAGDVATASAMARQFAGACSRYA